MSEAFFEIPIGDTSYELTRHNTSLYRHLGAAAVYDHLFLNFGESKSAYLWATHSQFEEIAELAVENQCAMHTNIQTPADIDVRQYIAHHTDDLSDFKSVPEEWIDETES